MKPLEEKPVWQPGQPKLLDRLGLELPHRLRPFREISGESGPKRSLEGCASQAGCRRFESGHPLSLQAVVSKGQRLVSLAEIAAGIRAAHDIDNGQLARQLIKERPSSVEGQLRTLGDMGVRLPETLKPAQAE